MKRRPADPARWQQPGDGLSSAVWVCPTDTVYGFTTAIGNAPGIERIQRLKGAHASALVDLSAEAGTSPKVLREGPLPFMFSE